MSQSNSTPPITDIEATKKKVAAVLEKIRPSLNADGGDAEIAELSADGKLTIYLLGACGGCAMASMTMRHGIERIIKSSIPEITSVESIKKES